MTKPRAGSASEHLVARPWSVPVALSEVPETGRRFDLVADEPTRAAIARLAGLAALLRLEASFDLMLLGRSRLHVAGRLSATVGQVCVVTLEPIENEIDEPIDLVFAPGSPVVPDAEVEVPVADEPEALIGGTVDLGAIATEFLLLGIDPYPRRPGAVFQSPPNADDSARPFASLAPLAKGRAKGRSDG